MESQEVQLQDVAVVVGDKFPDQRQVMLARFGALIVQAGGAPSAEGFVVQAEFRVALRSWQWPRGTWR